AKKELRLPCRIGVSKISYNLQEDPSLSAVYGLVLEGMDLEENQCIPSTKGGFMDKVKRLFRIFIP
ncbi:MAG: hypothetical protein Q8N69_00865, partial [bacterium]|nr:hypothetical protein [bacterium]